MERYSDSGSNDTQLHEDGYSVEVWRVALKVHADSILHYLAVLDKCIET